MIFQEPMTSLNPVLSVGAQISEAILAHESVGRKSAWRRAEELLAMVRIPEPQRVLREYPHRLSGGMRQRVMIAIAIACKPVVLIADEPTTALDVTIQAQILDLLDGLRHDLEMGLLLITHDLGVVAEMAARVVVMYAGRKVEEAPVREFFTSPRHPYSKGLLRASPRMDTVSHYRSAPLYEIPGMVPSLHKLPPGCPFADRCPSVMARCRTEAPAPVSTGPSSEASCFAVARVGPAGQTG
jgi:peptide/nickel transport system ATP-binding protein